MAKATRMTRNAGTLPIGRGPEAVRQRIEVMERLLERSFTIPGTRQTVGLDALLGLVPVGGDVITALMGLYMVWEARNLGMSRGAMLRMAGNVGVDWLIGLIPGVGDVADFFFRSNTRNLRILRKHLDRHHPATATITL
ncbi:hypothetical protein J2Y54_000645 [Sphingomonas sp. BE123]|nr:hypothetical protein [Sphingomonas sp. BE123]